MRVVIKHSIIGQICENVLHFNNPDGFLTNTQIKDEIIGFWTPPWANVQNEQLLITQISVQQLTPQQPMDVFPIAGAPGALLGPCYAQAITALCSIRTATAGRRGHGRVYLPGLHGESVVNGNWHPDAFAAWQVRAATVQGRFRTGGTGPLILGVCSRANPDDFKPMTALVMKPTFGIQRRRNTGVGS